MDLTVIGHLCRDITHGPAMGTDGPTAPAAGSFGGIMYSVAALASLAGERDTIHPVFGVGQEDYDELIEALRQYPNVNPEGVYKFKGPTNEVHLIYQEDQKNRIECSKHISPPIPFSRIRPYLDSNGLLLNMISGFDITLEALDSIRMEVRERRTPIHFDFHSLTLGVDADAKRFRRPLTDWRRWCFMLNSIQLSEEEARGLTAEHLDESTLTNHLMSLMVTALVITRGPNGATMILQDIHKKLTRHEIAGLPTTGPTDPTGCGDVFGAAFFCTAVRTKDYLQAAQRANEAAAINAMTVGSNKTSLVGEGLRRVPPL
jgi:sugar/nucleoside kinase (ribokinase family)